MIILLKGPCTVVANCKLASFSVIHSSRSLYKGLLFELFVEIWPEKESLHTYSTCCTMSQGLKYVAGLKSLGDSCLGIRWLLHDLSFALKRGPNKWCWGIWSTFSVPCGWNQAKLSIVRLLLKCYANESIQCGVFFQLREPRHAAARCIENECASE